MNLPDSKQKKGITTLLTNNVNNNAVSIYFDKFSMKKYINPFENNIKFAKSQAKCLHNRAGKGSISSFSMASA